MSSGISGAGSPVPEVSWFRDGQVLSAAALPGVQISFSDGRAVLRLPAVTAAHSGRYSVRATNGAGQATSTAELLVTGESSVPGTRVLTLTFQTGVLLVWIPAELQEETASFLTNKPPLCACASALMYFLLSVKVHMCACVCVCVESKFILWLRPVTDTSQTRYRSAAAA